MRPQTADFFCWTIWTKVIHVICPPKSPNDLVTSLPFPGASCTGSNSHLRYLAIQMHLTLARTTFYRKHAKLFSFYSSLEVRPGLPSTIVLQLVNFLVPGSCNRLSVSRSQPGTCESAAQIIKFLDISIYSAVDLCPSKYDTEVANVVIPVELISD